MRAQVQLLLVAALLSAPALTTVAEEFTSTALIWVRPMAAADQPRPCARLLTLDMPQGWSPGDAIAVLSTGPGVTRQAGAAFATVLLAQETAVLEFPAREVEGCAVARGTATGEVLGALRALEQEIGAGVVVAVGLGASGREVLEAAQEAVAARTLGANGPRLAAAVAVAMDGSAPMRFVAGRAPPPSERWAERVPMLCEAIAPAAQQEECRTALVSRPGPTARAR